MAQVVFSDIQVQEGQQQFVYSKEGYKAKRVFKVTGANNTNPQDTLNQIYESGSVQPTAMGLPKRMAPHPSITVSSNWAAYMLAQGVIVSANAFMADHFVVEALSSTQAMLTVEYQVLNAMTQEPSSVGNSAPGLVSIASGVKQSATAVDAFGNQIAFPYERDLGIQGWYDIQTLPGTTNDHTASAQRTSSTTTWLPGSPNRKGTAQTQIPNTVIRFHRRETIPRNPDGYVSFLNSVAWDLTSLGLGTTIVGTGGLQPYQPYQVLCTRIESETLDNGFSYMVTYEFQVGQLSLAPYNQITGYYVPVHPALPSYTASGLDYYSSWLVAGYYTLPSGRANLQSAHSGSGLASIVQATQTPPDCAAFIFQVNGSVDFTALSLV